MPTRMRPICRQSRRSVAMNIDRAGDQAERHQQREVEGQQLDHQRRADLGAAHGELAGRPPTMPEPAKEPTSSVTAVELCRAMASASAGQHRHDRIAHGGAQPVAQHVAIGALDAGLTMRVANSISATAPARCSRTTEPLIGCLHAGRGARAGGAAIRRESEGANSWS